LLELARYIELNPVRAGMVARPADWSWSSFAATMGIFDAPGWLQSDLVLNHFGSDREANRNAYEQFVLQGMHGGSPLRGVKSQLLLGDETFRASVATTQVAGDRYEIKRAQRRAVSYPLPAYFSRYNDPKEAMARAYLSRDYSMPEIAVHARVSVKTVSRAVNSFARKKTAY
jgi:hypothetical protein